MRPSVSRSPCGSMASMPVIQNGEVAMSTAVSPLGTVCSAHTTPPLPKPMSSVPSTARYGHSRGPGSRSPRAARIAASIDPAITYRIPPISSGGIDSRAIRIAR